MITRPIYSRVHTEKADDGNFSCDLESIVNHSRDGSNVKKEQYSLDQGSINRETRNGGYRIEWLYGRKPIACLQFLPVPKLPIYKVDNLVEKPAFEWWVFYSIHKREFTVSYHGSTTHKNMCASNSQERA